MNRIFILFIVLLLQLNLFVSCERDESLDSINTIKLKDGTEFKGEIINSTDTSIIVILEKGKRLEVNNTNLIIEEAASFIEGYAPVKIGGKWGYLNKKGALAILPRFEDAWNFSEKLAVVEINGKDGIIDITGDFVCEPQYKLAIGFSEGLCGVYRNGKMVYINKTGKVIIDRDFDFCLPFSEERAIVRVNGLCGVINKRGEYVLEPYFDEMKSFKEGLAAARKREKWGYVDLSGNIAIKPQYYFAADFSEGLACVLIKKPWKDVYAIFIDKSGKQAIDKRFFSAGEVRCGLVFVVKMTRHFYIFKTYKWAFWDVLRNKPLTGFIFDDARVFTDGLAPVKVGDKWGYIDRKGRIAIEPQFDDFCNFSEGLAAVSKESKWGFINKQGNSHFGFID